MKKLEKVIKDNMKNPKFKKEYKKQQEINKLINRLTPRQIEIIETVKQHERIEYDRKAAAEELGLSSNTVDSHLQTVFKICNVSSFQELLEKLDMVD